MARRVLVGLALSLLTAPATADTIELTVDASPGAPWRDVSPSLYCAFLEVSPRHFVRVSAGDRRAIVTAATPAG